MKTWFLESEKIQPPSENWRRKAQTRLKDQTRPAGSLGLLENFLERLVAIQKKEKIDLARKRILIFAADHGVTEEAVSLYPKEVTRAMVLNFLRGGATINALARSIQAEVRVVDMGVDGNFEQERGLVHRKIRRGSRNMLQEPAMTWEEMDQALEVGWDEIKSAAQDGCQLLGLGEMGIGNTTAASAVVAGITRWEAKDVTGRGTGLEDRQLEHKIQVIEKALSRYPAASGDPLLVLQHLGGYEIAAMTGAVLSAARFGVPLVIDGWIAGAAVLAAVKINSRVLDYLFFAHQSEELGHRKLLEWLEAKPVLNLSMRLGEASGAALAMAILDAAARVYNETATFQEAGVAGRER